MTIELWALLGCGLIFMLSITAQQLYTDFTAGLRYTLSSRSEPIKRGPLGGRLDRNVVNQVEGLAAFIPIVLVISVADVSNGWTQHGALLYLATRALFALVYAFNIFALRSLIWVTGFFVALPMMIYGLIQEIGLPF